MKTLVQIPISQSRKEILNKLLSLLNNDDQILGVLLGGSLAYKIETAGADIDLFCLIDNCEKFESKLVNLISCLGDIDVIVYQGVFPWTEKLFTVYFRCDEDLSIDLCLIDLKIGETFFWEPAGCILIDKAKLIQEYRAYQLMATNYTKQPFLKNNPFCLAIVALKKIAKNLLRNHLWNSLEQLNIFRRYVMQIIRLNELNDDDFLGRVDRDIEDIIPESTNYTLAKTVAIYDRKDIAQKAILLVEVFISLKTHLTSGPEYPYQSWVLRQATHELAKLSKIHNHA